MEAVSSSFKSVFDPLDLEIIDRVYDVAWAYAQARESSPNTASDGARQTAPTQKDLQRRTYRRPRTHRAFDTLTEAVLATMPGQLDSRYLSPLEASRTGFEASVTKPTYI